MNILMIGRGIPAKQNPEFGIFEMDQAKAVARAGNHVIYFAVDLRSLRRWRKWGLIQGRYDGVEWFVYNLPIGPIPLRIRSILGRIVLNKMYDRILQNSPDVIHAHFAHIGYMAIDIIKKNHIPFIITEHLSDMNNEVIGDNILNIAKETFHNASRVIAVSNTLADSIKKKTGVNCEVIPNIMGEASFFKCRKIPHKGMRYIATCSLIERKRPKLLIQSFFKLYSKYKDVYLGFIGDGEQRHMLENLVKKLGIEKRVRFYGKRTREQMAEIYRKYDCFVLPSARETFGVAYIEAMSAGLPVIATICGGPEEFVTKENGMLISIDNEQELTDAMEKMYHTNKEYDVNKMRLYIHENFSMKAVADRTCSVYKKVLNKNV